MGTFVTIDLVTLAIFHHAHDWHFTNATFGGFSDFAFCKARCIKRRFLHVATGVTGIFFIRGKILGGGRTVVQLTRGIIKFRGPG